MRTVKALIRLCGSEGPDKTMLCGQGRLSSDYADSEGLSSDYAAVKVLIRLCYADREGSHQTMRTVKALIRLCGQ